LKCLGAHVGIGFPAIPASLTSFLFLALLSLDANSFGELKDESDLIPTPLGWCHLDFSRDFTAVTTRERHGANRIFVPATQHHNFSATHLSVSMRQSDFPSIMVEPGNCDTKRNPIAPQENPVTPRLFTKPEKQPSNFFTRHPVFFSMPQF
jgi:hypothetical protein